MLHKARTVASLFRAHQSSAGGEIGHELLDSVPAHRLSSLWDSACLHAPFLMTVSVRFPFQSQSMYTDRFTFGPRAHCNGYRQTGPHANDVPIFLDWAEKQGVGGHFLVAGCLRFKMLK